VKATFDYAFPQGTQFRLAFGEAVGGSGRLSEMWKMFTDVGTRVRRKSTDRRYLGVHDERKWESVSVERISNDSKFYVLSSHIKSTTNQT